jgi:hypothetical protein
VSQAVKYLPTKYKAEFKLQYYKVGERSVVARDREGGVTRHSRENFGGNENTSYVCTVMVDTCHQTFVKTHEYIIPRVNPKVNYGFWVILMCNLGSSNVTDGEC